MDGDGGSIRGGATVTSTQTINVQQRSPIRKTRNNKSAVGITATTTTMSIMKSPTKVTHSSIPIMLQRNLSAPIPKSLSPSNSTLLNGVYTNHYNQPNLTTTSYSSNSNTNSHHHSNLATTTTTTTTASEAAQHYSMPGTTKNSFQEIGTDATLNKHELNGLNIAGVAVTLLTSIFALFHPMFIVHIMLFASPSSSSTSTSASLESDPIVGISIDTDSVRDLSAVQVDTTVDAIAAALIPEHNQHEIMFEKQNLDSYHIEQSHQKDATMLRLLVFCIINPVVIVALSWFIDYYWCFQSNRKRTDLISTAGILFAVACTLPFLFPLAIPQVAYANVWSISIYDVSYFFVNILLTSALTECHNMTTRSKMAFMLSSEIMYLLVSVVTCQFGLPHFYVNHDNDRPSQQHLHHLKYNNINETTDIERERLLPEDDILEIDSDHTTKNIGSIGGFCIFLIVMVLIACTLFVLAQTIVTNASSTNRKQQSSSSSSNGTTTTTTTTTITTAKLTNAKQSNLHLQHLHDDTTYESDDDLEEIERAVSASSATIGSMSLSSFTSSAMLTKMLTTSQRSIRVILSFILPWYRNYRSTMFFVSHSSQRQLEWAKRIFFDIWRHKNFCIWIVTEMLHKAQNSFISYFLYFFMGRMVAGRANQIFHHHLASTTTFSNFGTIFLVSISKQIVTIIAYLPIAIMGYRQTYQYMFDAAVGMSVLGFLFADPTSDMWIVGYIFIFTTMTRSMHVASIYLVMSDLVLEMKHKHTVYENRSDDGPSVAALYLGINAFFAQPTRVIFAIFAEVVANALQSHPDPNTSTTDDQMFTTDDSKRLLFRCLLLMTFTCSMLQLLAWSRYDLRPRRIAKIREELKYSAVVQVSHMLLQQQLQHQNNNNHHHHHTRHGSSGCTIPTEVDSATAVTNNHPHHSRQTLLHRTNSNREIIVDHQLLL